MLGPLDGVDTQGEAHRRGGQHGQDVAAMVSSGPATVSRDSDSMSVLPVGVRASCTGAGPTRARSSLITERATFSWSAMACWVHPDPAHTWAWATWRPVSLGGRPRRWRTRAAEPPWRARPRSIDT